MEEKEEIYEKKVKMNARLFCFLVNGCGIEYTLISCVSFGSIDVFVLFLTKEMDRSLDFFALE